MNKINVRILLAVHIAGVLAMGFYLCQWYEAFMICFQITSIILYYIIGCLVDGKTKLITDGLIMASLLEIPDTIFNVNQYLPNVSWFRNFGFDVMIVILCTLITYIRWNRYGKAGE